MVEITMQELLEAGVHFGHQTRRWNPKMKPYIFGKRNGIYIIDLAKTLKQFREAAEFVHKLGQEGRRLLFVGTKRQAQDAVAERGAALRPVLRHPPLAGWHAHQLRHHPPVGRASARDRGAAGRRGRRAHQEGEACASTASASG